jgi:hypothetical protein
MEGDDSMIQFQIVVHSTIINPSIASNEHAQTP